MSTRKRRSNGSGSIFKSSTGDGWIAQIRRYDPLTGKSKQIRRRARTRDEARERLAELKTTKGVPRKNSIRLGEYLARWCQETLPHVGLATTTQAIYYQCLTYYGIPAAGHAPLGTLTPGLCEQWLEAVKRTRKLGEADNRSHGRERDGEPISSSTVRNTYMAAIKALDTAVRDGLIDRNPLREIPAPKVTRPYVPVRSANELETLLEVCSGRRIEPLVYFVAFTGCRIGEALALEWRDVDLEKGTATLRRSRLGSEATKNRQIRMVTLIADVSEQLKAVQARTGTERATMGRGWHESDYVFTSASGHPLDYNNVTHELKRALKTAQLPTGRPWHAFRHGLAHRLLQRGVPLQQVSALLGHRGLAITADVYGHVDSQVDAETLSKALGRSQFHAPEIAYNVSR